MNPWVPLGATLAFNVGCHVVGLPTLCSTTRKYVPREVAMPLLAGGAVVLAVHVWRGY